MKIGFFDTGLGGVTIFKSVYNTINADYIYLADNKNVPYGLKSIEQVKNLTEACTKKLIKLGCEIIVIACNTATSAAVEYLRNKYADVIFIGTEPAIKPAVEKSDAKKIILTGTTLTLKGDKLKKLLSKLNAEDKVTLLPLDKLVEFSDFGDIIQYDLAYDYLKEKFVGLNFDEYSGIVLGCTHFPIFKNEIRKLLPKDIEIFDSACGITKYLKNIIETKEQNEETVEKSVNIILTKDAPEFENKFNSLLNE